MSPETVRTERLLLEPLTQTHAVELFVIFADPQTWEHLPSGRHRSIEQTRQLITRAEQSHDRHGLGPWAVREQASGDTTPTSLIGIAGCTMLDCAVWNLGYRFARETWGRGLATEACRPALSAATQQQAESAVTARALTSNPGSIRVLDKLGLTKLWSGTSVETRDTDPDDTRGLQRVIYADRPLEPALLSRLIDLG